MANNDSFIREVEEELRSDRLKAFWDRFGTAVLALAVLVVLATGGKVFWDWYTSSQANASGDRFMEALNLAGQGKPEEALAKLESLESDGYGRYPVLASLRSATIRANAGDKPAAVAAFDAIAGDAAVPGALRDIARLRAAYLLVDDATYADVAGRVGQFDNAESPLRHSAREAMGLAAFREGNMAEAKRLLQAILDDPLAPPPLAGRARIVLDLIAASGAVAGG